MKYNELLEKNNEICEKLKIPSKKIVSEPVCNEKYIKAIIKSYNGKTSTTFHNNKILKSDSQCIYWSVILIHSVLRTSSNYYPQVFLEECKYVVKEKKMPKYIINNMDISSNSGEENSNEKKLV